MILADGPEPVPSPQPAIMDQIDKTFVPHVLTIGKGQKVEFPNSDNIRHHVYSFSRPKPFEIRLYKGKPGAPIQFDRPGIVVLGCNIHDSMVGYIVMSDTAAWGQTDADGRTTIDTKDNITTVRVWHPRLSLNADTIQVVTLKPKETVHRIALKLLPHAYYRSGIQNGRGPADQRHAPGLRPSPAPEPGIGTPCSASGGDCLQVVLVENLQTASQKQSESRGPDWLKDTFKMVLCW